MIRINCSLGSLWSDCILDTTQVFFLDFFLIFLIFLLPEIKEVCDS